MTDGPLIVISTDDRIVYTGATGTGKTLLARDLNLPYIPKSHPVVILDPKRDSKWANVPDIEMPRVPFSKIKLHAGAQAYRWPKTNQKLSLERGYTHLVSYLFDRGNVLVISDETSTLYRSPHEMDAPTDRLIREGRARNIGIWWLMQRPSNVPTIIMSEAETWFAFTLRKSTDRKTTADYIGDDAVNMLPQEEGDRSHFFWHSRRGYRRPLLMRLWLGDDDKPVKLSTYPQYHGEEMAA